jgi:serine protease Do
LIKIDGKDLPTLPLGDSDQVNSGDWVLAVGSPFQFPHTVTSGIVSAKARRLGGPFDDFIQTDASINPGNSGGPLVNMRGEVIGMNALIVSPLIGNVGLGFAIPVNLIKTILPELREKGKVVRAYLGVYSQDLTPELAESFGLKETQGVVITQVSKDSPADKAGLKDGDIIQEADGKPIESESQLRAVISAYAPDSKVVLKIYRSGQTLDRDITVEKRPEQAQAEKPPVPQKAGNILGLKVTDLTPDKASALGYQNLKGALVVSVTPDSPVADIIEPGDLIMDINGVDILSARQFNDETAKLKPGQLLRVQYAGNQRVDFFAFRLP